MNRKGFTLIELLAVIIILAIVALIATPIIMNVITDARLSANKTQVELILKGAEQKFAHSQLTGEDTNFDGETNIYKEIDTTNEKPENGEVYITSTGEIAIAISIDGVCYYKKFAEENISQNDSEKCYENIIDTIIISDYDIVADLKSDPALVVGDIKTTAGYYERNDGGASEYEIIASDGITPNEMDYILLNNGLVAKLKYTNEINVMQLGAHAVNDINSINTQTAPDNSIILNKAFNIGVTTVDFPQDKTFLVKDRVFLYTPNVSVNGNGSNIYHDDTFNQTLTEESRVVTLGWNGQGSYGMVTNISWDNLNIISDSVRDIPFLAMQMGVLFLENSSITNSIFRGPGPKLTKGDDGDFASLSGQVEEDFMFNNLDLWTSNNNITIENNEFYLSHDGSVGLSLQIRDIWRRGTDNIIVRNNYFEKVCHDEILAISPWEVDITNVVIDNNEFVMYDGITSKSVLGISIGAPNNYTTGYVKDLVFTNNKIDMEYTFQGFNIDFISGNFTFTGNTINSHLSNDPSMVYTSAIFFTKNVSPDTVFNMSNNVFNISADDEKDLYSIVHSNGDNEAITLNSNQFNVDGHVEQMFNSGINVTNNTITSNSTATEISRNLRNFSGNNVTLAYANSINAHFDDHLNGTITYSNNNITMTDIKVREGNLDHYILLEIGGNNMTIADNTVFNFENNTVTFNDDTIRTSDYKALYYGPSNPNSFVINYKNNNVPETFKYVSSAINTFVVTE